MKNRCLLKVDLSNWVPFDERESPQLNSPLTKHSSCRKSWETDFHVGPTWALILSSDLCPHQPHLEPPTYRTSRSCCPAELTLCYIILLMHVQLLFVLKQHDPWWSAGETLGEALGFICVALNIILYPQNFSQPNHDSHSHSLPSFKIQS